MSILTNWLRANSAGAYRNSALAADYIDDLERQLAEAQQSVKAWKLERTILIEGAKAQESRIKELEGIIDEFAEDQGYEPKGVK